MIKVVPFMSDIFYYHKKNFVKKDWTKIMKS